jgi:c-di-GMP-binding flagellar brake protein YcgR
MNDKRHFQRIGFVANCILQHKNCQLHGRVENISLNGVLVRADNSNNEPIQQGDKFILILGSGNDDKTVHIPTQVVHHAFNYIGLKFIDVNKEIEDTINVFMSRVYTNKVSATTTISNLYHSLETYTKE